MKKHPHAHYMALAIEAAKEALKSDDVPVGAVAVYKGEVIATAYNTRERDTDPTAHAEIRLIQEAARHLNQWQLKDVDVYVTLEPCPMCAGALVQARVRKLIYGARDPKAGCAGTLMNLTDFRGFNHRLEVIEGILEGECSQLLSDFFKRHRRTLFP